MRPFLLASAFLILASPLIPQDELGASLTIRFDGTNWFHVGEIIPVELSFKVALPGTYDMNTRNYDRSPRLDIEQFHVTRPGRTLSKATIPRGHSSVVAWRAHECFP